MVADRIARAANINTIEEKQRPEKDAAKLRDTILKSAIFSRGKGEFGEKLKECYSEMMLNL
jgi:hypothetical protein